MKLLRISLVGLGAVGQHFAQLLYEKQEYLQQEMKLDICLVGAGSPHHGFVSQKGGLDLPTLLRWSEQGRPLAGQEEARHWGNLLRGVEKADAEVLVEATARDPREIEPGLGVIETALRQGMHVVTSQKGACARAGLDLLALARKQGVQLRMGACVMPGTPVLSMIEEGMAGACIQRVRGMLNGATNVILAGLTQGRTYAEVLTEAQARGDIGADPSADVEGYDAQAQALILAALVFRQQLRPEQVPREDITALQPEPLEEANKANKRIKSLVSICRQGGTLEASVALHALPLDDPLARIEGTTNALAIQTDTPSEMTIVGPGPDTKQIAQSLLADVLACCAR